MAAFRERLFLERLFLVAMEFSRKASTHTWVHFFITITIEVEFG
jgi:hypothetical protein